MGVLKARCKARLYIREDENERFELLPEDMQTQVLRWIRLNFVPRASVNNKHSSYGLKHLMQWDEVYFEGTDYYPGIYLTNDQFKDAMLECGFFPEDAKELNWRYAISENSPILIRDKAGLRRRRT